MAERNVIKDKVNQDREKRIRELESKLSSYEDVEEAKAELAKRKARRSLLAFMMYCWWEPGELLVGRHTRAICDRLTRAVDDFLLGKSTKLIIDVPVRHGKSDMVSRAFPAWFLGRCAEKQPDVMIASYAASLSEGFNVDIQRIMRQRTYAELFPSVKVPGKASRGAWSVVGSGGEVNAVGIQGGATGKGAHLLVIDDPIKDEKEAYSEVVRNTVISQFQTSFVTRLAPTSIAILCNTRWHVHDLTAHILQKMNESKKYPRWEHLSFPAQKKGKDGWDYLFPERFSKDWYDNQRATLRPVMASAMLDCKPVGDGVCVFNKDWIQYYNRMPPLGSMNIYILIDSANAKKKSSDYTVMFVVGLGSDENYYILDCIHDRMGLTERADMLFSLWEKWRPHGIFWEQIGAMSDVQHVQYVQDERGIHFPVTQIAQQISKEDRIRTLEPLFRLGRVWFPRSLPKQGADGKLYDAVRDFVEGEYSTFPAVQHDDMLDCLANLTHKQVTAATFFPKKSNFLDKTSLSAVSMWYPEENL